MMKQCILYLLCLFCTNIYAQKKVVINICSLLSKPSVMAFKIPSKKCQLRATDLNKIKKEINDEFEINAYIIDVNLYYISKYDFVEIIYKNSVCDTAAILFFKKDNKNFLASRPYSVGGNIDKEFRALVKKDMIVLYRKVKNKLRGATASFEFNKKENKLDSFIDDGFSIWQ